LDCCNEFGDFDARVADKLVDGARSRATVGIGFFFMPPPPVIDAIDADTRPVIEADRRKRKSWA
jgi:hypothetical protein